MEKFDIYKDIHVGALHALMTVAEVLAIRPGPRVWLLGDIVDLQNCPKDEINYYKALIRELKQIHGDNYRPGNHELVPVSERGGVCRRDGVLGRHLDWEFWGTEKLNKYLERAKPGAGWFKRNVLVRSFSWLRRLWTARYSKAFKERCVASCFAHSCHTIVGGHKHPLKKADFKYKNIRIVVLPRGKNILEL